MRRLLIASFILVLALAMAVPSQADHNAPNAAGAEAYGLSIDVGLLPASVPVQLGPVAWAAQDYPPGAAQPSEVSVVDQGPVPADGSVLTSVGALNSIAGAFAAPQGAAGATVAELNLFEGLVTAELISAEAVANCTADPSGTVSFTNVEINGQAIEEAPPPNTVIDLQIIKVILNEQQKAFDGRGIVVNAIHILSTSAGDDVFRGDIIVSHAMATAHCQNGPGTTGAESDVPIAKDVTPSSTTAGGQVTYTANITNDSDEECLVTRVVDHLPPGFSPVSTSGPLGTTFEQAARPGGGVDVSVGSGVVIAPAATVTQTFVVKVGDNVAPGTYWNNVEVFCANLGNFIKGLDAPVTITAQTTPTTAAPTTTTMRSRGELPATGGDWPSPISLLLVGGAAALFYKAAAASKRDL
jgi:uncharacterized repeat protein (TIGR01451 family)